MRFRRTTCHRGLPVFAAISRTWVDRHRQQRREELLKFSAAALALFVIFGAVMALQEFAARHLQNLIG